VALVLSGGSALGIAHVGVIRELEKAGIPIDMVLGTSMGALIGGLYAAGYSPDQLESIVVGIDWRTIFSESRDSLGGKYEDQKRQRFPLGFGFSAEGIHLGRGLFKGQNILTLLTTLSLHALPIRDFDNLPLPYRAVAADILSGERIVFSHGSLAEAMRASISIPGLFRPYIVEGRSLVDGGIVDNLPVDLAREMGADIVIAVESRPRLAESDGELKTSLDISNQTLNLYIEENMRPSRADADLYIRPDLSGFTTTSYSAARRLVERGAEGARAQSEEIAVLARRIERDRPLVAPDEEPNRRALCEPPVLERLDVDASRPADVAIARAAFAGLVGRRLDREELKAAIDRVYASGDYSLVKFDLAPLGDSRNNAVGVLSVEPDYQPANDMFVGASYRGLVSAFTESDASVLTGLFMGGLSGLDSAFYAEAGLGKGSRILVEYFQPAGPFFLKPFLKYQSVHDSRRLLGSGLGLDEYCRSAGGGLMFGLRLGKRADAALGWSFEDLRGSSVDTSSPNPLGSGTALDDRAGTLTFALEIDTRSAPVFPSRGLQGIARIRWADPAFGGGSSFTTAELRWNAAIQLSHRLSLGLAGLAATDFSGFLPGAVPIRAARLFDLRSSGMFYGLESRPERGIGNDVAGLGLEVRGMVGRISPLLGGDLFALANLSAGTARVTGDPARDFLPLRWDASLGFGARFSPNVGLRVTAGIVADGNSTQSIRPALAFDFGSMTDSLEDAR
jgi:NTE family protein